MKLTDDMQIKLYGDIACPDCKGYGLALVCNTCKGYGYIEDQYIETITLKKLKEYLT